MVTYDIQKLIAARMRHGWDQTKLAAEAGLSQTQLNRIERGHFAKPSTILRIAKALGVPMAELIIEDDVDRVTLTVSGERPEI